MEDDIIWSDVTKRVVRYYVACLVIAFVIYFFVAKAEKAAEARGIRKGRAEYWDTFPKAKGRKVPVEPVTQEGESNG